MATDHTSKSFDKELEKLKQHIYRMGGAAEAQFEAAIHCIGKRDGDSAPDVIAGDKQIDEFEATINAEAVRVLALRQPMANDLREVLSALKIASDLERIGDYAANIAKRSIALAQVPAVEPVRAVPRMGRLAQGIIKDVLDAYIDLDVDRAIDAWRRDEELDDLYTALFRQTLTYMMEDTRMITPCTHLLFIAKNIERIGDHATNIAETVHFQITGRTMADDRPKGDNSSYEVVNPSQDK
ncbi:phosphate signaling complex protein PhoU [Fodinicurvata sp. EGI_FJ10296]|uniref:phosphate signaling complex protein PhoU n=1 Tax=Fodinicurvata sp. EGI_FJ10296 TaxID=3231908 RepID=UPI00345197D8